MRVSEDRVCDEVIFAWWKLTARRVKTMGGFTAFLAHRFVVVWLLSCRRTKSNWRIFCNNFVSAMAQRLRWMFCNVYVWWELSVFHGDPIHPTYHTGIINNYGCTEQPVSCGLVTDLWIALSAHGPVIISSRRLDNCRNSQQCVGQSNRHDMRRC